MAYGVQLQCERLYLKKMYLKKLSKIQEQASPDPGQTRGSSCLLALELVGSDGTRADMSQARKLKTFAADGITGPFRHITFRRIWLAGLLANLGAVIRSVGAAWAMTQMTSSADMVALFRLR